MNYKFKRRQYSKRHNYTLIEVLAAMGIFIILMTALMQFFTSARNIWVTSARRNELYANARIALDLISRDLQSAMYQNDDAARGIYPFWFRERFGETSSNPQVNELNFIASTDLKPANASSKMCEIRYTFITSTGIDSTLQPANIRDSDNDIIPEGWLVRSCVGDNDTIGRYNFADYAFPSSDAGRMLDIWSDADDRYTPVIPGVFKLDITCYSDVESTFDPMKDSEFGSMVSVTDISGNTKSYPKGQFGTMFPQVITIRIKLMDEDNWKIYLKYRDRWIKLTKAGASAAAKNLAREINILRNKSLRTFSRTIYMSRHQNI